MTINGLKSAEVVSELTVSTLVVHDSMTDRAILALEALTVLGRIDGDRDMALESIKENFAALEQSTVGLSGETYIQLPFGSGFRPHDMLSLIAEPADSFTEKLWFWRSRRRKGDRIASINRLDVIGEDENEPAIRPPHARYALSNTQTAISPLLHLLNLPYDAVSAEEDQQTQLGQLAHIKSEFETEHTTLELNAINLAGIAMIAMQRRLEGRPLPLSRGIMRIPQLGRRVVGSESYIGDVNTVDNRLGLNVTNGFPFPTCGIGVSVALKGFEPPAA